MIRGVRIDYLPMDAQNIRQVAGWLHAEFGPRGRGATLETRTQRVRDRAGSREIPLTFVAYEAGVPMGTASLVAHDLYSRRDLTPWLASVYVLPAFRGRGVGAALCRRALREAARLGFGRLHLFTFDQEKFYASMGWTEIERTEFWRQKVTVMVHPASGF
jgi:GNAT superfamily N-acetyltransferase